MSTTHIPRFLLPRGPVFRPSPNLNPHPRLLQPPTFLSRAASNKPSSSSKPRALEKPAKFNPPSHPSRLNRPPPRQYPGPPLSASEKEAQKTKQYPHMMPAEGTFTHWFLTSRGIHLWLTLAWDRKTLTNCLVNDQKGTLFSLALYTFLTNFRHTSPFAHLLPPISTLLAHPFQFVATYVEVYKLHTARISAETAERRRRKVEDVRKRGEYRKAHGLDKGEGFGGWTAREEGEELGTGLKVLGAGVGAGDGLGGAVGGRVEVGEGMQGRDVKGEEESEKEQEAVYADWEGRKKPVKKWLGLW